jgi:phosphoserine phosphatase
MDSTLIQSEVIDELARHRGVYKEVSDITSEAMNGKMDFDESLRLRVAKLKGMPQADLLEVFQKIKLTPGAEELLRVLKKLGYKIALISGGFMFVAERLKTQLGIDYVYANTLESNQGVLTGNVLPPIVNAQRKADLLDVIAQQENIELDQVIAIGDGANDILMLEKAGLGIAFNAKPTVREKADLAISQKNLKSVLYLLGLAEKDLSVCFKTDTLR